MKSLRLQRWGSQILPLATKQPGLAARQPIHAHNVRWQTTTTDTAERHDAPLKRKRGRPSAASKPSTSSPSPSTLAASPAAKVSPTPSILSTNPLPSLAYTSIHGSTRRPMTPFRESPVTNFQPSTLSSVPEALAEQPFSDLGAMLVPLEKMPSPPISAARTSAKLAALHSRLSLPKRFPIETLARTLVDKSADRSRNFNNYSFSILGNDLLGYYMGEYLLCQYPRLPIAVLTAAQSAYVGPAALAQVAKEWGVEVAAEPGSEVNPGLLQFRHIVPGTPIGTPGAARARDRLGLAGPRAQNFEPTSFFPHAEKLVTTLEDASANFIRAVLGAIYMHAGADTSHAFFKAHILSRRLDIASLFTFTQPTRDLSRLCAREGFESPVARLISETGRLSRVPVFVVGVFSGRDKLGEAAGSSLNEARFKASVHALKGWYLYSPKGRVVAGDVLVPSMMEGEKGRRNTWIPAHIDDGEVVV